MAVKHDETVLPVLGALLDCVVAELTASELTLPGFAAVHVGAYALDHIGEGEDGCGGELAIALTNGFASTQFPNLDNGPTTNTKLWGWTCTVSIIRCTPNPDGEGGVPDPETLYSAGQITMDDMQAMRRAICTCMKARTDKKWFLSNWDPYGPAGSAAGGTWTLTFQE